MDKPLTRNTSIIELTLTIAGILLVGGIAWGTLASDVENISQRVNEDHQAIQEMRKDLAQVETEVARIKVKVEATDERAQRIENAVNTLLMRIPNGHNGN